MEKIYKTIKNIGDSGYNFNEIYNSNIYDFLNSNDSKQTKAWCDYLTRIIPKLYETAGAHLRKEGARLLQRISMNPNKSNSGIFVMGNGAIVVPYSTRDQFFLQVSDTLSPRIQKSLLGSIQKAEEEIRSVIYGNLKDGGGK